MDDQGTSERQHPTDHEPCPPTDGESVGSPETIVARIALKSVEEAMQVVLQVMKKPTRGAQTRLTAALKIIDLAIDLKNHAPAADGAQGGKQRIVLIDTKDAVRVLRQRLGNGDHPRTHSPA